MTTDVSLNLFNFIPIELLPEIFKYSSHYLDRVALVCKDWQEAADSQALRREIRPLRAMGIQELMKINPNIINAGIELLLPRCAYRDLVETGGLLFFNPGTIEVKNDKGEPKKVVLDSPEAIGNLFKAPNLETYFTENSYEPALKEKRREEAHWVLMDLKVRGLQKSCAEQKYIAKKKDKRAYPERYKIREPKQIIKIVPVNDLVLGILMARAILKKDLFTWDPNRKQYIWIRVADTTKADNGPMRQITVKFTPSGLSVCNSCAFPLESVGFVCARKSFGS